MTAPVRPAALRHRLMLETSTLAADGALLWTPVAVVFGALEPIGEGEGEAGASMNGRVTHRIQLRWRDGVSSRDRLVMGARIFRIVAVRDLDERRTHLLIRAEEESR